MAQYRSVYTFHINRSDHENSWMRKDQVVENNDEDEMNGSLNEILSEIRGWSEANDEYLFNRTQTHNLLLMGRTRTGKTTIANVLENPCYIPPLGKLYSETKQVTIHPIATRLKNSLDDLIYCFNIIDTPGMFDRVKYSDKSMKNSQIKLSIEKCLRENVPNIHLFGFVINLESNLEEEDIQSMIYVKTHFPFLIDFICLIVTHCEETSPSQRQSIIEEFFQSEKIRQNNLKDFFGKKVFFMGSLRSQLKTFPNRQSIKQQITNIHQMRRTFLQFLLSINPNNSFNVHQIQSNQHFCQII